MVATRRVDVPGLGVLGAGRLNGIADSPDAERIWITISGPQPAFDGAEGAVVEIPAFGAPSAAGPDAPHQPALVAQGAAIFQTDLTPAQGLGPLFNAPS
jgi:hypothetical protein